MAHWRSFREDRANPRRRTQRDEGLRPYVLTGHELDSITLCDCRDDQRGLGHRELVADTTPRSAAERDVGESWTCGLLRGREPIRVEARRFRPQLGPAMDDEGDDKR